MTLGHPTYTSQVFQVIFIHCQSGHRLAFSEQTSPLRYGYPPQPGEMMGHKIALLITSLILLANTLIPPVQPNQSPVQKDFTLANLTPVWATGVISDQLWWKHPLDSVWLDALDVADLENDGSQDRSDHMIQGNSITQVLEPIYYAYLPVVTRFQPGIYGKVTESGKPANGIVLSLRFFDGRNWSTAATTTTSSDGTYIFKDMPTLKPGQEYYVLFSWTQNFYDGPTRLPVWQTRSIESFQSGDGVHIGDFDVADVRLYIPDSGEHVSLPATFKWIPRTATPSDRYIYHLYDKFAPDQTYYFADPPLGYLGRYTLNTLPSVFYVGMGYFWDIMILSPDGGVGRSAYANLVYIDNSNRSSSLSSPLEGQPTPPLELKDLDRHP